MRTRDQAPTPRSVKESTLSQVAFATKCFSRILDIFQTICHSGPGYTEEDQIHELLDHGVVVRVNTFFFLSNHKVRGYTIGKQSDGLFGTKYLT
jgi:hypothetical protein